MSEFGDLTYDELVADRNLFDRVVRVIGVECDLDYIEAMDRLDSWAELAGGGKPDVRLEAVLRGSAVPLRKLESGAAELALSDSAAEHAIVRKFERSLPGTTLEGTEAWRALENTSSGDSIRLKLRDGSEVVATRRDETTGVTAMALNTDAGLLLISCDELQEAVVGPEVVGDQVRLAKQVDRARLLADPIERERAFLEARELSRTYSDPETGREAFEKDFRAYVEAGLDLVGTLRYREQQAELNFALQRVRDQRRAADHGERRRRAEERRALELDAEARARWRRAQNDRRRARG